MTDDTKDTQSVAVAEMQSQQESQSTQTVRSTATLTLDRETMQSMVMFAEVMARGVASVPQHLRGNVSDCLAVTMQAIQWKMNPYAVAQKTHLVSGVLGYEAQLVNAVIISLAPTKDRLHFEWTGNWEKIVGKFKEVESSSKKDDYGKAKKFRVPAWDIKDEDGLKVRVWATLKGESEPRELTLMMTQARTRNSTLWADDPKQQLAYLAIKRWSRLYTPDVIMGVYTPDELEESLPMKDVGSKTGAEFGELARASSESAPSAARDQLVKDLERNAALGINSLNAKWLAIGKENRKLVGATEWERVKTLVVETAPAAADETGPSVSESSQEAPESSQTANETAENADKPAAEVKGDAVTQAAAFVEKAQGAGPTYAQLVALIKKAKSGDDLAQVMSDSSALPDDQQAEILTLCKARNPEIGNG